MYVKVQLPSFQVVTLEVPGATPISSLVETLARPEASVVDGCLSHRGVKLESHRLVGELANDEPLFRVRFHPDGSLFNGGGRGQRLRPASKRAFLQSCAKRIIEVLAESRQTEEEAEPPLRSHDLKLPGFTEFTVKWLAENVHRYPDATVQNLRNAFQRERDGVLLKMTQRLVQGSGPEEPIDSPSESPTGPLDRDSKKARLGQVQKSALGKLRPSSAWEQHPAKPKDTSCLTGLDSLTSAEKRYLSGIVQLYTTDYVKVMGNNVTWRNDAPTSLWVQPPDPILSGRFADPIQHRLPRIFLATYEDWPTLHPLLPKQRPECPTCGKDDHVVGHGYRLIRVLCRDGRYFALTK